MTELFVVLSLIGFASCIWLYRSKLQISSKLFKLESNIKEKDEGIYNSLAIFYKNPQQRIDSCSPALQKLLGVENDITLEKLRDFFRTKNPGVLGGLLTNINENGKEAEAILNLPGGTRKVRCVANRIDDNEGLLGAIILYFEDVGKDISEIESVQEKVIQSGKSIHSLLNILNASPYPMWQRDKDLKIAYANFSYLGMIKDRIDGISDDEKNLELYPQGKQLAQDALKDNETKTERKHIVAAGERRLYKVSEIPFSDGTTTGFARDISEQEEIEEELEHNIASQSHFLESSTGAAAIYGPDQKLRFFNNAFVTLWELDEEWLEGGPSYGDILDKLRESRKLPEQVDFKAFKQKLLDQFTNLVETSSEEFLYLPDAVVLRVISVPHESGGLIISYEDITDRLALEQSYNTLIAVKRATIDNLHEGIALLQEDGRLNLYNPVFADIWQLESEFLDKSPHLSEILEESKFLYEFDSNWNEFKDELSQIMLSREFHKQRLTRKDGSVLDWSCVPLPDGNTLISYIDITDSFIVERSLRAEKEALKEADTLKSNFLANVSYELRSPLTSIRGFSEALLQNYFGELSDKQREYVDDIYKSSLSLSSLINDVLDMASINAGYMTLDFEEINLNEVIKALAPSLEDKFDDNYIGFEYCLPNEDCLINADKKRIIQIINNLISNAISRTKKGDQVKLVLESDLENIRIIIEDNGKGISINEQERIFEEFYKTEGNKRDIEVTSLALPIVKSFIELHDGKIELESSPDGGTKFICIFKKFAS